MFGISLSGIKNSQKYLDVTSNNIANANTIGFKKSRAEFADVYTNSVFSNNKTTVGMGSQNACVAQQFFQGSLSGDTGNSLDMAIQGNGFFVLSNENNPADGSHYVGDRTYTRAGAFQVTKDGYIVTSQGDYLQGWDVDDNGDASSLDIASTHSIKIPADTGAPRMSTEIGIGANLPAGKDYVGLPINTPAPTGPGQTLPGADEVWNVAFDPKDNSTYTCSTSQTIHDSLGNAHTLTYYMMKDQEYESVESLDPNGDPYVPPRYEWQAKQTNETKWNVVVYVDGKPVDVAKANDENPIKFEVTDDNSSISGSTLFGFQLTFGPDGQLTEQRPSALYLANNGVYNGVRGPDDKLTYQDDKGNLQEYKLDGTLNAAMGGGVIDTQDLHINFEATQYGSSSFTINKSPTNDGYSTGLLVNVQVNDDGLLQAEYSNGRYVTLCKIAMADFANQQGLTKIGDTQWKQSISSGEPTPKEANKGGAGAIKGSNLELSNVDLTSELVDLIVAQRNYQANSQSLQTQNTAMDSIMNIR